MRRSLTSRAARLAASAVACWPACASAPANRRPERTNLASGSREAAADATNVSERTETAAKRAVGAPAVLLRALGYRLLVGHGGRF